MGHEQPFDGFISKLRVSQLIRNDHILILNKFQAKKQALGGHRIYRAFCQAAEALSRCLDDDLNFGVSLNVFSDWRTEL